METNLLDRMLNTYLESRTPVVITLQNKIRVSGRIRAFDSYVMIIEGPKREIVYRHAVSSVVADALQESHRAAPTVSHGHAPTVPRTPKPAGKPRSPQHQPALAASPADTSINNSMKEGLLRWMQEQKAAK
ncbi:MAG TPA: RNA chaperone Hfq [Nitrospirota bacterium]|nr:RNA chaperone Hfq [Nitrospirota bacterium]